VRAFVTGDSQVPLPEESQVLEAMWRSVGQAGPTHSSV